MTNDNEIPARPHPHMKSRLIRTLFHSPSNKFQYKLHRLIRIPDKTNGFSWSPGVRINEVLPYSISGVVYRSVFLAVSRNFSLSV